jgi:hypothetical protein
VLILVLLFSISTLRSAYALDTCGDSDEELFTFLETFQMAKVNDVLKVEEQGRVKAVIYDREDIGLCIATFDRKLFGLRWKYDGMDTLRENGVQSEGSWHNTGIKGSKCDIVICGDNRNGGVGSYVMTDYIQAARDRLESDFIIDIYIADGVSELPRGLQQYTPDGSIFVPQ